MGIEAVIFDLGGTLIEYAGPYTVWPELETPGFRAAYNSLTAQGAPLPAFTDFREAGFTLLPERWRGATRGERNLRLVDLLQEALVDCRVTAVQASWLEEAAEQYQAAVRQQAEMIENAPDVLQTVKTQGYKLGLISNTMFTGAAHVADLERFGLADYFDVMLFSADVDKWKPNPEPFWQVAEELGVAPETAVYIGDDPASDVVGGRRAGLRTIHFQSNRRFPTPDGVEPHARVERLNEAPGILQQWENHDQ